MKKHWQCMYTPYTTIGLANIVELCIYKQNISKYKNKYCLKYNHSCGGAKCMLRSCSLDNISIKLKCNRLVAFAATLRINYQGVNWDNMVCDLNING